MSRAFHNMMACFKGLALVLLLLSGPVASAQAQDAAPAAATPAAKTVPAKAKKPVKGAKAKHGKRHTAKLKRGGKQLGAKGKKKVKAKPVAAKPAVSLPLVQKTAPVKPKEKPKGLSAKALGNLTEEKIGKSDESNAETDDEGFGVWKILLVFLLFTAASAGTFVYLKRRNDAAIEGRQDSDFAAGTSVHHTSMIDASSHGSLHGSMHGSNHGSNHGTSGGTNVASRMPVSALGSLSQTTAEPCPFEQFVEMQVAQACWAEQGLDLVSHLRTYFNSTMLEWSKISIYWKPRYLASPELKQRFDLLEVELKKKYGKVA